MGDLTNMAFGDGTHLHARTSDDGFNLVVELIKPGPAVTRDGRNVITTELSHGSVRHLRDVLNAWLATPVMVQCHNCPHPMHLAGNGSSSACTQCDCMAGLPEPDIKIKRGGIRFPVDTNVDDFRAMLDKVFDAVEPGALAEYQEGVTYENDPCAHCRQQGMVCGHNRGRKSQPHDLRMLPELDDYPGHNPMCAVRDNEPVPCDCKMSVTTKGFIEVPMPDDEEPCTNCGKHGHPRHMCLGPSQPLTAADTYRAAVDRAAKDH